MNTIPGPRGFQSIKMLLRAREHYGECYRELQATYGDVVSVNLPYKAILLFKPSHIRYVLKENAQNYHKSRLYQTFAPFLGKGLLTSEGELWKKQRRIVAPEFHMKSVQGYMEGMIFRTLELADEWDAMLDSRGNSAQPASSEFWDVSSEMMKLTFKIVGDTLFGSELGAEAAQVKDALYTVLHISTARIMSLVKFPKSWPTPSNLKFKNSAEQLQTVVRKIIQMRIEEQKRVQTENPGAPMKIDVLTRLLTARAGSDESMLMSDQQLIDEINTMILAGHETTSQTLSWTWYLLAKNPEVEKKLHAELKTVLQGRTPQVSDLSQLVYTKMVLKEAMRLYPPVPVISRSPLKDDQVDGISIPAGIVVSLCPYATHRDPQLWEHPDKFDPERFSPSNEKKIPEYAYFPFSGGPRSCVGEHFAMAESVLILAILSSKFRLTLKPGVEVKSKASITLSPLGGLPMRIEKREQVQPLLRVRASEAVSSPLL